MFTYPILIRLSYFFYFFFGGGARGGEVFNKRLIKKPAGQNVSKARQDCIFYIFINPNAEKIMHFYFEKHNTTLFIVFYLQLHERLRVKKAIKIQF